MKDLERLLNYYAAGRIFMPRPRYLCFNATLRCDGHCGHCGIWKVKASDVEISAKQLNGVLASSFFNRVETAWITGGEPTLRQDVDELARAMTSALPSLNTLGIATNALDPDRTIDRITAMKEALKPDQGLFVHISLDGVGEVHDAVRERPGAFQAVSETIDRLLKLGGSGDGPRIEVGLNCVIQPRNAGALEELYAFARERNLSVMFNVVLVTDQVYRNLDMEESLRFSEAEKTLVIRFLERVIPESPPAFQYQYRIIKGVIQGNKRPARCLTLYTTININADGQLIPCPAASDIFPENVLDQDVENLWKSSGARGMRERIRLEFCPSCMLSCSLGDSMPVSEWLKGGFDTSSVEEADERR